MKITALETIHLGEYPTFLFVRVHTDEGLIGCGDTYRAPQTVAAWIHEMAAPLLLGQDPQAVERHWHNLYRSTPGGLGPRSADMRGLSAIDIALWDICGQAARLPLYRLLGGPTRESLPVYNTCAGYRYGGRRPEGKISTWHSYGAAGVDGTTAGPYEDLEALLNRPGELAESLVAEGYPAMKIWPFDPFVPESNGHRITLEQLNRGCEPLERIRQAVGERIEFALEMHSLWSIGAAKEIAAAVEPYRPMWFEDPVRADNIDALLEFRQSTRVPTTASETLATRWGFREAFEKRALNIAMFDVGWTGGITEARKLAAMADTYQIPISPHDCVGPLTLAASVHLGYAVPNAMIQEVVRAYLHGVYPNFVTEVPRVERGVIQRFEGPGLGTQLLPTLWQREDAVARITRIA